eukprot:Gb_29041 [translate_table: standard]
MASHNTKYRVFLSFRGPDVRKSLVDHLYLSLFTAGIHTFIDSEKLEKGHDIGLSLEEAIGNSDIYIPIFSTNYAYSPWCLEELSLMCSHISTFESNHKLIPLFYNVEPSDVRYPDTLSAYAKAFQKYSTQGRYNTDTINRWKDALNEASSLSGWSLKDTTYGYEGRLVKQVLMDLLKMLNSKSLDVAKHPVGLENRMNNLKDMLKTASNDNCVRTVGICGMGGIGKTTLSKAVFNEMKSMFDAACFVSEVRASAHQFQGLRDMQRQILRDLSKVEMELSSVDEGKAKMREYLGSVRALLILDDVDGRKQLEALYGDRWFGRGSRVIITTRDKHILNLAQADEIYETEELEHNQALELFSWHAFLRVCPDEGYEHLSERVVKACKGLPLSLEVMGAHLYDKKHETMFWDEALSRIESVMDKDLYETLKISFTSLHEEEKQIFLDISCFFLGEEREIAIGLWEALGCRNPRTAIVNLSLKSLITVDTNDDLLMHDHLRDLGREIVAEESRDDPYKRSRLWHPDHLCRVLGGREEIPNLRGFKSTNLRVNVPEESLALMKNFTFLWFKNVQLSKGRYTFQGKTRFPPKLKWLRLEHCSKLRGIFNMSHMDELKLSGLESLESLTDLNLKGWKNVKSLAGMEVLKSLKRLIVNERSVSEINVQQWIQGLSGFQVLCLSANRIPKWLKRRMQTMPQPANGAFGKYCVLEDIKCTGIVFCLWMMGPNYGGLLRMNISTEEDTIYGEFPLPDLSSFDGNEQHVGILHEELPSIIKFRSGDIIGCSPATLGWGKVKMVGVHLQMDQNQSGNNEIVGTLLELEVEILYGMKVTAGMSIHLTRMMRFSSSNDFLYTFLPIV